jgi:hypothetical protein
MEASDVHPLCRTDLYHLDNLRGTVQSASLEAVLTSTVFQERLLGTNRMLDLPQKATWVATTNNADIGGDLLRRCYLIRLDAKSSRPWQGREFTHGELLEWVRARRGDLLAALLTMARAWVVAGRPSGPSPVLGKFESWSKTIGGILNYAGNPNFLGNLEHMHETMDEESGQWEAFLRGILQKMGNAVWLASDLVSELNSQQEGEDLQKLLPDELKEAWDAASQGPTRTGFSRKLGRALRSRRDTRYGESGIHLVHAGKDSRSSSALWRVADSQKSQKS